jgi:hypothetical protein
MQGCSYYQDIFIRKGLRASKKIFPNPEAMFKFCLVTSVGTGRSISTHKLNKNQNLSPEKKKYIYIYTL